MHSATIALVFGASAAAAASIDSMLLQRANGTAGICSTLAKRFPGQIELPGSSNYTVETTGTYKLLNLYSLYILMREVRSLLVIPRLSTSILRLGTYNIQ